MDIIIEFFENIGNQITSMHIIDYIDITIVTFIFYFLFRFVRDRNAGRLLAGIIFLCAMLFLSDILQMRALNFILQNLFSVGLVALIVVFQPELRSMLEKMGGEYLKGFKTKLDNDEIAVMQRCISEVCSAAESLSSTKTGALIVFERSANLGDYVRTGTVINSDTSSFLLLNIFFNKAPLHDGAVIIRSGRIFSAGCFLPLSGNSNIIKALGTRHRAGIGMSENSDAVVLIVSEETGLISLAVDGILSRGFTKATLEKELYTLLINEGTTITKRVKGVRGKIFKRKTDEGEKK